MQNPKRYFIIDFDSTFIQRESLEELADVALSHSSHKQEIISQISYLTKKSMEGSMEYGESLAQRLRLFHAHQKHILKTVTRLKKQITPSIQRNKAFFKQYAENIYIISGGFKEIIEPIVETYGIDPSHVYANTFTRDAEGNLTGLDTTNLSAYNGGKVKIVKQLNLDGDIYVIGDGHNDSLIKQVGPQVQFFLFTENIRREKVVPDADHVISSFDELLFHLNLPRSLSYPKSRMNVLLLEKIHQDAVAYFEKQGYNVTLKQGALSENELREEIEQVSILGIRSQTYLTEKVLEKAKNLIAVGAFCIGTNQIDLQAATQRGVAVFNAPFSNTRSVVELTLGFIIMLMRRASFKSREMHSGTWNKSATGAHEIRGKKLGIVGYGNIGTQLSVLAESIGLEVYFYDHTEKLALGNAKPCASLDDLLKTVDIVSLHVDGRPENAHLIGKRELSLMKKGSILINTSRGPVVSVDDLVSALQTGHLAGAALDVFPEEPKEKKTVFKSPLQNMENVILTPHIGGSTEEAQEHIASFVADKITQFVDTGETTLSVNVPSLKLPELNNAYRILHIHKNVPGIMAQINNLFAEEKINIEGQYLKTNEQVGYVITDINKKGSESVIQKLRDVPGTIRVRILY